MVSDGKSSVIISGLGVYEPEKVLTNDDLAQMVETNDEWIVSRTGIHERRIAAENETASSMAVKACEKALAAANIKASDIDLIVVATITPDMPFPATACLIQEALGIKDIPAFDIQAACSGFIFGVEIVSSMLRSGNYKNALLVGVEKMSSILDWQDRSTCVLFGDGAGVAVLSKVDTPNVGIIDSSIKSDGKHGNLLYMKGGGSNCRPTPENIEKGDHYLKMNGREVYKHAVRTMEQAVLEVLERNSLQARDINYVIPHQANLRIIESLGARLEIPMEKFIVTLGRHGNTSAASIPLAMEPAFAAGKFKPGDKIILVAFGAGLTWGATLIQW